MACRGACPARHGRAGTGARIFHRRRCRGVGCRCRRASWLACLRKLYGEWWRRIRQPQDALCRRSTPARNKDARAKHASRAKQALARRHNPSAPATSRVRPHPLMLVYTGLLSVRVVEKNSFFQNFGNIEVNSGAFLIKLSGPLEALTSIITACRVHISSKLLSSKPPLIIVNNATKQLRRSRVSLLILVNARSGFLRFFNLYDKSRD